MSELKPCPFCGSEANGESETKFYKWTDTATAIIICSNLDCGVYQYGQVPRKEYKSPESACEAAYEIAKQKWNRRVKNEL